MARISTKVQLVERDVAVIFPDPFSDANRKAAIVSFARKSLAEAQAQNQRVLGRVPEHEVWVDGRKGGSLDSIDPDKGHIVYEFELLDEVLAWIGEQLIKHSPIGPGGRPGHPGLYMRSHVLFADLDMVEPGAKLPNAAEYSLINLQPYARKIERGSSDQAPDGVYQAVATLAAGRFGNVAKIKFSYRVPNFGAISKWASGTSMASPYRRDANRDEWLKRQPAVVITPR